MTNVDEPFRFPDLNDVLEMERIVNQGDENKTAAELEEEIIRYISRVQDKASELIRAEQLAFGDATVLRPAVRLMQTSLRHLFASGEMLPSDQRVRYLTRLKLTIMAVCNIGGFTHITNTVEDVVRKDTHARVQKKGTEAAQAKRAPNKERRQELVKEIWSTTRIRTASHVRRELQKRGLQPLPTAKTIRSDLNELGLSASRKHRPKECS
jgi:hypothetical protein